MTEWAGARVGTEMALGGAARAMAREMACRGAWRAGERIEGVEAEQDRELAEAVDEADRERLVVDHPQSGHLPGRRLIGLQRGIALDLVEVAGVAIGVGGIGGEVPGVDERAGRDRL